MVVNFWSAHPKAVVNGDTEPTPSETVFSVAMPRDPNRRDAEYRAAGCS